MLNIDHRKYRGRNIIPDNFFFRSEVELPTECQTTLVNPNLELADPCCHTMVYTIAS
jgi:hypothetical protein